MTMRTLLAPLAAGLMLVDVAAGANDVPGTPDIRYHDGRLTVRLKRVPLDTVVTALEREVGIEVQGETRDWREVTKRFDDLPLPEALDRLIGKQNFILWYDATGQPRRVELLGVPLSPSPRPGTGNAVNVVLLMAKIPPIPVSPPLARALGGSPLPLSRLTTGLRVADPTVRGEVQTLLLRAIEENPSLRDGFRRIDDPQLTNLIRAWSGPHADDVLRFLSSQAHDPTLRAKASAARARMQNERPGVGTPTAPRG